MRPVISMVPSWTETLIHAGFNVVGRTRYCIHPLDSVRRISVLGGTKTFADSSKELFNSMCRQAAAANLRPIVVLDEEENSKSFKEFFDEFECDVVVTRVTGIESFKTSLEALLDAFSSSPGDVRSVATLKLIARRIEGFQDARAGNRTIIDSVLAANRPPAAVETTLLAPSQKIYYFIWKNPWMVVTRETWIGEILQYVFPLVTFPLGDSRYPEIAESEVPEDAVLLFSSEPFPFEKQWSLISKLPFVSKAKAAILVDGESFSWFGIRSIRFLEDSQVSP